MGSRCWGAEGDRGEVGPHGGAGKREKEAALVAGTWGSVGCRMGCGHPKPTAIPLQDGRSPPYPLVSPHCTPRRGGDGTRLGASRHPKTPTVPPNRTGMTPPQSLPPATPVGGRLGVAQLPWGDPRDTPTHRGVGSRCHPRPVSPPTMDWGVPETPTHHGMGPEVPPIPVTPPRTVGRHFGDIHPMTSPSATDLVFGVPSPRDALTHHGVGSRGPPSRCHPFPEGPPAGVCPLSSPRHAGGPSPP